MNIKPDIFQARYWEGPLSRAEAQKVMDAQAKVIVQLLKDIHGDPGTDDQGNQVRPPQDGLITLIARMDVLLAFLTSKIGATPEEVNAWQTTKLAEFAAIQAAAKASDEQKN